MTTEEVSNRVVDGRSKIGYSLGTFGVFLLRILISTFIFQFYVYTINLNSVFVSIGISLYLIISAVFSIFWGVIIDRKTPGRFGRRRPFLLIGLPVWIISNILIWMPPFYCPPENSFFLPTTIYFWTIMIFIALSDTLIYTAYLAMFPEQFRSKRSQESIATMQGIFLIIASIIALLLPLIVQNLVDPENVKWWQPSGNVFLFWMPIIGISSVILGVLTIFLVYFSVDESFYNQYHFQKKESLSIKRAFTQILVPLKDKKYRKYLSVRFFNSTSSNILGIAIIPFLTFVLEFREIEFFIYVLLSTITKFTWYFLWKYFFQTKELKQRYSFCIASGFISSFLILIFFFNIESFFLKIVLFIIVIGTVLGSLYAYPLFAVPMSAILVYDAAFTIDEFNLEEEVSKISGAYYGSLNFMISLGKALGSILMGIAFIGPNQENPLVIVLSLASMGIFYLISFISLRTIEIRRNIVPELN
jgi:Na+/melibiose symporter-like transporter